MCLLSHLPIARADEPPHWMSEIFFLDKESAHEWLIRFLLVAIVDKSLCSRKASRISTPRRDSPTNLLGARLAEQPARPRAAMVAMAEAEVDLVVEASDRCTQRFARAVGRKPRFPSNQRVASPFTARSASRASVVAVHRTKAVAVDGISRKFG